MSALPIVFPLNSAKYKPRYALLSWPSHTISESFSLLVVSCAASARFANNSARTGGFFGIGGDIVLSSIIGVLAAGASFFSTSAKTKLGINVRMANSAALCVSLAEHTPKIVIRDLQIIYRSIGFIVYNADLFVQK